MYGTKLNEGHYTWRGCVTATTTDIRLRVTMAWKGTVQTTALTDIGLRPRINNKEKVLINEDHKSGRHGVPSLPMFG